MARPRKHDGVVYCRKGTQFWWMRYWDSAGNRREEPTGTADWKEAHKKLRERLQARDDNVWRSSARASIFRSSNGRNCSWKTTQSHRYAHRRHTKRTLVP